MPDSAIPFALALVCALLAAGTTQHPERRRSGAAGAAMVAFALGLASVTVASRVAGPGAGLSGSFLTITTGLLLLAPASQAGLAWDGRARPASAAVPAAAMLASLAAAAPFWRGAGWWPPLVAAGALAGGAAALLWLSHRIPVAAAFGWLDDRLLVRQSVDVHPGGASLALAVEAGSALVALFAGGLDVMMGAVLVGLVAGGRSSGPTARRLRIPVATLVSVLLVASTWWLLARVADPAVPRTFDLLVSAPFSPALERLVVPLLLGGAWLMLRLWPFHGTAAGSCAPVLGVAVLGRGVALLFPAGAAHWLPLVAAVAAFASLHGAATGRRAEVLFALGAVAVLAAEDGSRWAGTALVVAGCTALMVTAWSAPLAAAIRRWLVPVAVAAVLPAALAAAMFEETVWTTVIAAGLAAAWRDDGRADRARVDRAVHPGHIPTSDPGISPAQ